MENNFNTEDTIVMRTKRSDLIHAITQKLIAQREKIYEINKAKERAELKRTDEIYGILDYARQSFPQHKEYFNRLIESRLIEASKVERNTYVGYKDEEKIKARVTEFNLNNNTYKFDQIYNFVTAVL